MTTNENIGMELASVVNKLTRDLANASKTLSQKEARYLVDLYYQMQDNRIRSYGQEGMKNQRCVASHITCEKPKHVCEPYNI